MIDLVIVAEIASIVLVVMMSIAVFMHHEEINNKPIQKDSLLDAQGAERKKCTFCGAMIYFRGKNNTLCPFCDTYN